MQMLKAARAALCAVVVTLIAPVAAAEEAAPAQTGGGTATPGVEEPAAPDDTSKAAAQKPAANPREADTREAMCLMIEAAAKANDLPLEFFARVIWQESRFQSDAVGPLTRRGERAQGIAQFMPGTASERRLLDPFDPVRRCRNPPNSSANCATSSAISGWPQPPTMPDRGGCRNGSRAQGRCRRRRAITSLPLPAPRSMNGPRPAGTAKCPTAGGMPAVTN
jgi:hypothetical protein